jgi:predicted amidohydrolase YtcJ
MEVFQVAKLRSVCEYELQASPDERTKSKHNLISTGNLIPDLILHSGHIHTGDSQAVTVGALSIVGHRVQAVGQTAELLKTADQKTKLIDLKGSCVIPGLTDGHAHLDREGLRHQLPSLQHAQSLTDVLDVIADEVRHRVEGSWILTQPIGRPPEFLTDVAHLIPTRFDLDRVSPKHPVFIRPIWGYWSNAVPFSCVANSMALNLAGIGPHTRSPSQEVLIDRDATGQPTGIFWEKSLVPLVEHTLMRCAPGFSSAQREQALLHGMAQYNKVGTTCVFEGHGVASEVIQAYKSVHASGASTVRALLTFSPNWQLNGQGDAALLLKDWAAWVSRSGMGDDILRVQGLYAEIDSDPHNNQLRASNHPCTGWAGFQAGCALPLDVMKVLVQEAARSSIRLCGIWPNLLDLFEYANQTQPIAPMRWVLGHQRFLTRDQIARIKDLGIVLTTHTNRHIYKDGDRMLSEGMHDLNDLVPLQSLLQSGVPVAFGSDNMPPSLFHPMWHAISRKSRGGQRVGESQAIERNQALKIATQGGAYLCFDEGQRGRLIPGFLADLAILSADPLVCDEEVLPQIQATGVMVNGRFVL